MNKQPLFDDNIQNYRQPMVTSIGIMLGFFLAYSSKWAIESVETTTTSDILIGICFILSIVLLITALYRLLDNRIVADTGKSYRRTLYIYISSVIIAFTSIIFSIIQTIF